MKRILLITLFFSLLHPSVFSQLRTMASSGLDDQGFPAPKLRTDLIPPSPNVAAFTKYGDVPVSLYNGQINYSIPICDVRDGNLSLPITLSYNYNGARPGEVAGWVGTGWNLTAGGVITHVIKDKLDGTMASGYNYDEYAIHDSISQYYNQGFLEAAADFNAYDLEPDYYTYNFCGHSGKFFLYKGKVYIQNYEKLQVTGGGDAFTIYDENGTRYDFDANEITHIKPQPDGLTIEPYVSSWYLTRIVSANQKEVITLNYSGPFTHAAGSGSYTQVFHRDDNYINGSPSISSSFNPSPSLEAIVLQSISTRNTRIVFDTVMNRGNYPSLHSIKIYNQAFETLTGNWQFEYDGSAKSFLQSLRQLPVNGKSADTAIYQFEYEPGNTGSYFSKGVDHWGFYNGKEGNMSLLPSDIFPQLATAGYIADREPNFTYAKRGILKKVTYPTKGSTSFEYEGNTYTSQSAQTLGQQLSGPGVRIKRVISMDSVTATKTTKIFDYTHADGVSSGILFSLPFYPGKTRATELAPGTSSNPYQSNTTFQADFNSSGGGLDGLQFYYSVVTERDSSSSGEHKTTFKYNAYQGSWYLGVDLIEKTVYLIRPDGSIAPLRQEKTTYYGVEDTAFVGATAWKSYDTWYAPGDEWNYESYAYGLGWKYLAQKEVIDYDSDGNSLTTVANYSYDKFRNVQATTSNLTNGATLVRRFKYPENYTSTVSGTFVGKHVLAPYWEQQVWRKKTATDSVLLSAEVTKFDPVLLAPVEKYYVDPPLLTSLNNETTTGGLYNNLLSDSRYKKRVESSYEPLYGSLVSQRLVDNVTTSFLWDYNYSQPIAQVTNAQNNEILFDGFEAANSWEGVSYDAAKARTGRLSARIDNPATGELYFHSKKWLSVSLQAPTRFKYSGWVYSNGPSAAIYLVMKKTGETAYATLLSAITTTATNKWVYVEGEYTVPANITQLNIRVDNNGGGSVWFDDIRLHPSAAQMTTYTYEPLVGLTSQTDINNHVLYYDYDGLGRLALVRDENQNALKKYCYNYQGQPDQCGAKIYYSEARSQIFFKQCAGGVQGSAVAYSVATNKYTSIISLADANAQRDAEIAQNGQAYANQAGACTWGNVDKSGNYYKQNCGLNQNGNAYYVSIPQGMFSSAISQLDADQKALQYGQSQANQYGTCFTINTVLYAQNNTGVAGFVATYTNVSTGVKYSFQVTNAGYASLGDLPQGVYNLTIAKSGNSVKYSYESGCDDLTKVAPSATWLNITVGSSCNPVIIDFAF